jgi:hypothetical protein
MFCKSRANSSSEAKFPASWENTGNFAELWVRLLHNSGILFVWASECAYWLAIHHQIQWFTTQFPNASEQGIYFGLARELNRAIREVIRLIRESQRWPPFHCEVNRVSEHSCHRYRHARQGRRQPQARRRHLAGTRLRETKRGRFNNPQPAGPAWLKALAPGDVVTVTRIDRLAQHL